MCRVFAQCRYLSLDTLRQRAAALTAAEGPRRGFRLDEAPAPHTQVSMPSIHASLSAWSLDVARCPRSTVHGRTVQRSPRGCLPRPPRRPGWESNGRQQRRHSDLPFRLGAGSTGVTRQRERGKRKEEREKKASDRELDLPSCGGSCLHEENTHGSRLPACILGLGFQVPGLLQRAPVVRSLFLPAELGRRGGHVACACRRRSFPFLCLLPTPGAIASIHSFPPTRATHPRHPDTLPCSCSSVGVILEHCSPSGLDSFVSLSLLLLWFPSQLCLLLFSLQPCTLS